MKNNIKNIIVLGIAFFYLNTPFAQSQTTKIIYRSNVTEAMGLSTDLALEGTTGEHIELTDVWKNNVTDVFAVVVIGGSTMAPDNDLLSLRIDNQRIMNIVYDINERYDVRRDFITQTGATTPSSYLVYDDLFTGNNTMTFIISPYFIAIMVDEGADWRIAPILFGLKSNEGTDEYSTNIADHISPFFNAESLRLGLIGSTFAFSVFPMNGDISSYSEFQTWLADADQQARAKNAKVVNVNTFSDLIDKELVSVSDTNLNIFPNPSSGTFNMGFMLLQETKMTYHIHDLLGTLIHTDQKVFDEGLTEWQVNSDAYTFLQKGIYLITLSGGDWQEVRRIVIE